MLKARFLSALNTRLQLSLDLALDSLGPHFKSLPPDMLSILKTLHRFLDDNYFTSLSAFTQLLKHFYLSLAQISFNLVTYRRQVLSKMKRALLERASASILENLERLTQAEREQYMVGQQRLVEQALQAPETVDFGKFDIDSLLRKEATLVKQLQRRDEVWFGGGRDD
jgi:methylase of polypeptide subunit release factors